MITFRTSRGNARVNVIASELVMASRMVMPVKARLLFTFRAQGSKLDWSPSASLTLRVPNAKNESNFCDLSGSTRLENSSVRRLTAETKSELELTKSGRRCLSFLLSSYHHLHAGSSIATS